MSELRISVFTRISIITTIGSGPKITIIAYLVRHPFKQLRMGSRLGEEVERLEEVDAAEGSGART